MRFDSVGITLKYHFGPAKFYIPELQEATMASSIAAKGTALVLLTVSGFPEVVVEFWAGSEDPVVPPSILSRSGVFAMAMLMTIRNAPKNCHMVSFLLRTNCSKEC